MTKQSVSDVTKELCRVLAARGLSFLDAGTTIEDLADAWEEAIRTAREEVAR